MELCFYQTLILTAPIHCRASIAETHFYKPDEETNSSTSQMTFVDIIRLFLFLSEILFESEVCCCFGCFFVKFIENIDTHTALVLF